MSLQTQHYGLALQRSFLTWAAKVAAGFHLPPAQLSRWAAQEMRRGSGARLPETDTHAEGHALLRAALDVRSAECLGLRERVARLETQLSTHNAQQEALKRSHARAISASSELLDARRQLAHVTSQLAIAQRELKAMRIAQDPPSGAEYYLPDG